MQAMIELREKLMDELSKMRGRELTDAMLEAVDKITHSIKSIDTIIAMEQSSRESRDGYSGRRYRDGYSNEGTSGRRYRDDYSEDGASGRRGYFYTQRDDGGASGRRLRDSMGRYADGYSGRYSRAEAKDKLIDEMEGMMGEVSPEAQHAIKKAIHALDQE